MEKSAGQLMAWWQGFSVCIPSLVLGNEYSCITVGGHTSAAFAVRKYGAVWSLCAADFKVGSSQLDAPAFGLVHCCELFTRKLLSEASVGCDTVAAGCYE